MVPASRSFSKTWKIVKPKPISDSDVRITDISVRSALMRVRWNDMPAAGVRKLAHDVHLPAEEHRRCAPLIDGERLAVRVLGRDTLAKHLAPDAARRRRSATPHWRGV